MFGVLAGPCGRERAAVMTRAGGWTDAELTSLYAVYEMLCPLVHWAGLWLGEVRWGVVRTGFRLLL